MTVEFLFIPPSKNAPGAKCTAVVAMLCAAIATEND